MNTFDEEKLCQKRELPIRDHLLIIFILAQLMIILKMQSLYCIKKEYMLYPKSVLDTLLENKKF